MTVNNKVLSLTESVTNSYNILTEFKDEVSKVKIYSAEHSAHYDDLKNTINHLQVGQEIFIPKADE